MYMANLECPIRFFVHFSKTLIITIDRERYTRSFIVNTFRACVYFSANVGKLSYLVIVLMEHTMVVNIQFYFLSLDLISRWLTRDIG